MHQKCCGSEEGSSPTEIVSSDLQSPWPSAMSTHSYYFISSVRIFGACIDSQLLKSDEMGKKICSSKYLTAKFQLLEDAKVPKMHSRLQTTEIALKEIQKLINFRAIS